MYRISDISYKEVDVIGSSGQSYKSIDQKIKVEGYNRWISAYRFRECDAQEKRNISLSGIFNEEIDVVDLKEIYKIRKINRLEENEKYKILLSTLLSSILDISRNNLSTIEWASKKKGKAYDIKEEDFDLLLDKKLGDIIKMFD